MRRISRARAALAGGVALGVVALVLSLIALGVVARVLSLGDSNRAENAPTPVLVATRFIPAGTPLERVHLYVAPATRVHARREQVLDAQYLHLGRQVTTRDIYPGEQIVSELFRRKRGSS